MTTDDFDVQVLRLQPGDVVALMARRPLTQNEGAGIRERWEAKFPHIPCVVLDDQLDIAIVRPEPA